MCLQEATAAESEVVARTDELKRRVQTLASFTLPLLHRIACIASVAGRPSAPVPLTSAFSAVVGAEEGV